MRFIIHLSILLLLLALPISVNAEEEEWDGFRFDLESLDGDDLTDTDVFSGGDVYLVDFWASWCKPCAQYLPLLEGIVEDYEDQGFKVVLFSIDEPGAIGTAKTMLQAEDFPFTILFDIDQEVKNELGVRRIPTTILFDASGKEIWRHIGYEHGDEEAVREQLVEIFGEPVDSDESEETASPGQ